MKTILYYLFLIRFRKLVSKDDNLAIFLIVILYFAVAFLFYKNYNSLNKYIFIPFLEVVIYHIQRSDIEFLKLKKNYKTILLIEYIIYSLPFYLILILKKEFVFIIGILLFQVILINVPKLNLKVISYPFDVFNVFWHITFRKFKLIYTIPLSVALTFISIKYHNENLIFFVFLILTLISSISSFERERTEEIKRNPFNSEKYLLYQFKNALINTFYLTFPIALIICFYLQWDKLFFLPIIFIMPLVNILLKYIYFSNGYLHQIVFAAFIALNVLLYGLPLILIPFLYKKAIKNINELKIC